ncbi:MAG TPA: SDR family NAD(P)-dependent oxidoreductase, partial [Desulfobacteria bacterium]|nr:SDR family NAD(P)-dependent oxidoreductase [Desulfobacteria bacterium]
MRLKGKIAIITGGGSGIGRAIACLFAENGAHVVIAGRTEAPLINVAAEIKDKGYSASYVVADVSKSEQVNKLVSQTIENFGRIDILVNNAGLLISKSVTEHSEEEFD